MKQGMRCLHTDQGLHASSAGWAGLVSSWGRSRTWALCFKGNSMGYCPWSEHLPRPESFSKEAEPPPDLINECLFTSSPGHSWVRSLGWDDPLETEMPTHSSILAGRIPWTEEPGR